MDQQETIQNQEMTGNNAASEAEQTQQHEVSELQQNLQACEMARDEWKDKFMHVSADMQNYKRRVEKEQLEWGRRAQTEVIVKMLPIIDDFDRAMVEMHKREHTQELDEWLKGLDLIAQAMHKFLDQMHVAEIKEIIQFDPMLHEAIVQVPSDKHASGEIVDVIQKGYMFNGQVIRPAKVTVAK